MIIIAAMDLNRGIGYNNKFPWSSIPEDMDRFKDTVVNHVMIVGRKTKESMGLGYKDMIVVSSAYKNKEPEHFECIPKSGIKGKAPSFEDAVSMVKEPPSVYVAGGSSIYKQAIVHPACTELNLTIINHKFEDVDSWFPEFDHLFERVLIEDSFHTTVKMRNGFRDNILINFERWVRKRGV